MPRSAGHSIPKYRKHRASGQAVVTIGCRDHYLGPHGTKASKLEYDRHIAEWLAAGRRTTGSANDENSVTVAEVILAYWMFAKRHYQKNGKPTTEQPAIRWAVRPLKGLYGGTPAIEFGPLSLKAVRLRYVQAGHSRATINQNIGRLVRMFKWAAAEEMIPAGIPQALAMVSGLRRGRSEASETARVLPVDDATVERTLPFLPEVVMNMVMLQRFSAMRPAETCLLRPCDIDQSGDIWIYRPESHKTEHHGRERLVMIGHRAQGVLLKFLARDPEAYCFRPRDSEEKRRVAQHAERKTPLSCGNTPGSNRVRKAKRSAGERYDTNAYRRAIHRACDKAFPHLTLSKLKVLELTDNQRAELRKWQSDHRWSPNQLRHTAATAIRRRFGLEAAQVILGHSQANVTQIYAERDLAKGLEVAKQIG